VFPALNKPRYLKFAIITFAGASGGRRRRATPAPTRPGASPRPDVVSLSNLCVDVVVPVERLPPASDAAARRDLLARLVARPPPQTAWEAGGNANFLIAASRLGLAAQAVGHLGDDPFGAFTRDVLNAEGVRPTRGLWRPDDPLASGAHPGDPDAAPPGTLVCFVLVDPNGAHQFCSAYDFGPWPLLCPDGGNDEAPSTSRASADALDDNPPAAALWINGFALDELPATYLLLTLQKYRAAGGTVYLDPGPRAASAAAEGGTRWAGLAALLDEADVIVATDDEARAVIAGDAGDAGIEVRASGGGGGWQATVTAAEAEDLGRALLARPTGRATVAVIKRGAAGATMVRRGQGRGEAIAQPGFEVAVADTVGCGDSFGAALVLGAARSLSDAATLRLANAVGAATATGRGAGRQVARREDVIRILTEACRASCRGGEGGDADLAEALSALM